MPAQALLGLLVVIWLARSRTLSMGGVARLCAVSVPWALVLGLTAVGIADLVGLPGDSAGPMIALAGTIEEVGKLLPLAIAAGVAPGFVRRFTLADWYVAGWALGTGFDVMEEFARRARSPGLGTLGLDFDRALREPSTWTPWTVDVSMNNDATWPGHFVATSIVTTCIGLGMLAWRRSVQVGDDAAAGGAAAPGRIPVRLRLRAVAVGLPVVALLAVIVAHQANNALVTWLPVGTGTLIHALGPVGWALWVLIAKGALLIPISVILLVVAVCTDSYRRLGAGEHGGILPGAPVPVLPGVGSWPEPVRALVAGARALIGYTWQDWTAVAAVARRAPGEPRAAAMGRIRLAHMAARATRVIAAEVTTPGHEPGARRRFRTVALGAFAAAAVVAAIWGALQALLIGETLIDAGGGYIGQFLDDLLRWWDKLGPAQAIAVTALLILGAMALGASFGAAAAGVGVATWLLTYREGAGAWLRDPDKATRDYLTRAAKDPAYAGLTIFDFATTFIPGAVLAWPWSSELAARRRGLTARATRDRRGWGCQMVCVRGWLV